MVIDWHLNIDLCRLSDCVSLQDDIEAYKTQNKFLNSELYQLTRLWRTSSEQEKSLMMKVSPAGNTGAQFPPPPPPFGGPDPVLPVI